MKRAITVGLALCAAVAVASAQQPLVMVHGINSTPETWAELQALMANDGWDLYAPELGKFASFADNTNTLNGYFYSHGLNSSTVLLGHSMGGINSRGASRQQSVAGVVTVGTPHLGAPAARALRFEWDSPFVQLATELGWLRYNLEGIPSNGWDWANDWIAPYEIIAIRDRGFNAWDNMAYLVGPGVVATIGDLIGLGGDALNDLASDSPAIAYLNQSAWAEGGATRRSFTSRLTDGVVGQEFTFFLDPATADYYGNQLVNDGYGTWMDGWTLELAGEYSENWAMASAGGTIMRLGDMEVFYFVWWANNVIGSLQSDGVVPTWSQNGWPNVQPEEIGHAFHTKETSELAGILRQRVNELFNH